MHRAAQRTGRLGGWVAALMVALGAAAALRADELKLGAFWIPDVRVEGFNDGMVVYITAGGLEVQRPLLELGGMRLTRLPGLAAGQEALDAGKLADAAAALHKARDKADHAWQRAYIDSLLVQVRDRQKEPVEAVRAFVRLAADQPDAALLKNPPLSALQAADARNIAAVVNVLKQAVTDNNSGAAAQALAALLDKATTLQKRLVAGAATANDADKKANTGQAPTGKTTAPDAPAASAGVAGVAPQPSRIPLPRRMTDGPITTLLRQGRFAAALQRVDSLLTDKDQSLALRLYQRGLAQFYLARAADNRDGYLDAGLSFMRVIVYFPASYYAAPSMMELGAVHARIGRPDLAAKLYDSAGLTITADNEPALARRLQTLRRQLVTRKDSPP